MLPATKSERFKPLLELIEAGATIKQACERADISPGEFYRARKADPELQAATLIAQEIGAEQLADGLADIHTEIPNPLMARVVSDNRRWLLARRHRALYGDKVTVEHSQGDLTDVLREAIARIPRPISDQNANTIDATPSIASILGDWADDE